MSYSSTILADSPLIWYRMDDLEGATTVVDSSGNGSDGTPSGTITWEQQGLADYALSTSALLEAGSSITLPDPLGLVSRKHSGLRFS